MSPYRSAAFNEIEVPEGYLARRATVQNAYQDALLEEGNPLSGGGWITISVGDSQFLKFVPGDESVDLPGLRGVVPVGVMVRGASAYVLNVSIECDLDDRLFQKWQLDTYNTILNAYRDQKAQYDNELEDHKAKQQSAGLNPRFSQQLMERELKRICIEMLTRPFNVDITADHY